jgi:hypothetical protein
LEESIAIFFRMCGDDELEASWSATTERSDGGAFAGHDVIGME